MAAKRTRTPKVPAVQARVTVDLKAFPLPNFLEFEALGATHKLPVGHLTDEQAENYWDFLKPLWMLHVRARNKSLGSG